MGISDDAGPPQMASARRVSLLIVSEVGAGCEVRFEPEGAVLHLAANDEFRVEIGGNEGPIEILYGKDGLTVCGDAGHYRRSRSFGAATRAPRGLSNRNAGRKRSGDHRPAITVTFTVQPSRVMHIALEGQLEIPSPDVMDARPVCFAR